MHHYCHYLTSVCKYFAIFLPSCLWTPPLSLPPDGIGRYFLMALPPLDFFPKVHFFRHRIHQYNRNGYRSLRQTRKPRGTIPNGIICCKLPRGKYIKSQNFIGLAWGNLIPRGTVTLRIGFLAEKDPANSEDICTSESWFHSFLSSFIIIDSTRPNFFFFKTLEFALIWKDDHSQEFLFKSNADNIHAHEILSTEKYFRFWGGILPCKTREQC